jgi:DNA-directed RNA polymerase specialized sigma subunit
MYTAFMAPKFELTPRVFDQIEADYRNALLERRSLIVRRWKEGKTQREIAKYWGLDPARVYRIIKSQKEVK